MLMTFKNQKSRPEPGDSGDLTANRIYIFHFWLVLLVIQRRSLEQVRLLVLMHDPIGVGVHKAGLKQMEILLAHRLAQIL
jgi:hypothetical protein